MPLLPYQRQFLAWGVSQEQSSVRGGILADEMGMGKTLQVSTPAGFRCTRRAGPGQSRRHTSALPGPCHSMLPSAGLHESCPG